MTQMLTSESSTQSWSVGQDAMAMAQLVHQQRKIGADPIGLRASGSPDYPLRHSPAADLNCYCCCARAVGIKSRVRVLMLHPGGRLLRVRRPSFLVADAATGLGARWLCRPRRTHK